MKIKKTGGAKIGLFNATWPFATLKVDGNKLELSTVIMGHFTFNKNEVSSIQPYGSIPIIGRGIKINGSCKFQVGKQLLFTLEKSSLPVSK